MPQLKDKTAIVTGAGAGIGRAIASLFAAEGARVVVAEIEPDNGREVASAIQASGHEAEFVEVDVADPASVERMVQAATARFGPINVLVNNAAAFIFGRIEDVTADAWQRVLSVNVLGPANCVRTVLPSMRSAGGGTIVNIASVSGFIAQPEFVPYNTSKGALLQLNRCLAMDLAIDGIRVNAVCPGSVRTRATDRHIESLGLNREQAYTDFAASSLLKRMGEPREIAQAALFLASDASSFMTGAELVVDGGATIG